MIALSVWKLWDSCGCLHSFFDGVENFANPHGELLSGE